MAKFDESKVISALNKDKAEIGKEYYFHDTLHDLKSVVERDTTYTVGVLDNVGNDDNFEIFQKKYGVCWEFLYPYEESPKKETVKENEITDKTNGVMARKVEEKLNGLEVMAANLMQNIAYARSELLKKADEYEEKITANKTTLYLITGYTKEIGVWEVELFKDRQEATDQFKHYVEAYYAKLDEDNPNFAMCPDGEGRFWLEKRAI